MFGRVGFMPSLAALMRTNPGQPPTGMEKKYRCHTTSTHIISEHLRMTITAASELHLEY